MKLGAGLCHSILHTLKKLCGQPGYHWSVLVRVVQCAQACGVACAEAAQDAACTGTFVCRVLIYKCAELLQATAAAGKPGRARVVAQQQTL